MHPRNRLSTEASPYLLQHASNPVHWWPWCAEAFAEAKQLGKPVLLSVGYSACHWCHVMAHESFEHDETAALMNALFVNIKVDREERPDVDHVYMSALQALGQQGGWPLTMFLDGAGKPFWGGTYFPRESRYGQPPFRSVLNSVAQAYVDRSQDIASNAKAILAALDHSPAQGQQTTALPSLDQLARRIAGQFDPVHGGFNRAPKFPNPTVLEFLWRAADRTGDESIRAPVLKTLEQMALGGIFDHLGGGFARYSVDERWLVPHFEKMLYDNAQLLPLLALAAVHTGEALYRRAAEQTVEWLQRDMLVADGAFAASMDADSLDAHGHAEEGAFYVWTPDEIRQALGEKTAAFCSAYDISPEGNFEGKSIPNRLHSGTQDLALHDDALQALLKVRSQRPPPARDDKIMADWNGLMIAGLVRAGELLGQPHWITLARQAYAGVLAHLGGESILAHSGRGTKRIHPGFASDHAFMAIAALSLFEATGETACLEDACAWGEVLIDHYRVPGSGLIAMTAATANDLPLRPQPSHDDAIPNANPLALEAFIRLHSLTGATLWRDAADALTVSLTPNALANTVGHAGFFNALDFDARHAEIVLKGDLSAEMLATIRSVSYLNRTVSRTAAIETETPHATICARGVCSLPITKPQEFRLRIESVLRP